MSRVQVSKAEKRNIERAANDFDTWASGRSETIRQVCEGVSLSIVQQLARSGFTREELTGFFAIIIENALDPQNAAVFLQDGAKGSA